MCAPTASRPPPGGRPAAGTHAVSERDVAAGHRQQQPGDLLVAVFAGTHEGRGAVVVLHIDVCLAGQQGFDHVHPAVADRQHQGRLSCLAGVRNTVRAHTAAGVPCPCSSAVHGSRAPWHRRPPSCCTSNDLRTSGLCTCWSFLFPSYPPSLLSCHFLSQGLTMSFRLAFNSLCRGWGFNSVLQHLA